MKSTGGKANPKVVNELLRKALDGYIRTLEHVTLDRLRELGGATR